MDVIALIAERKIVEALEAGEFDGLPERGRIDCSLQGDAFSRRWWLDKIAALDAFWTSADIE